MAFKEGLRCLGRTVKDPYTSAGMGVLLMIGSCADVGVNNFEIESELNSRHPTPYTSAQIDQAKEAITGYHRAESKLILSNRVNEIPMLVEQKGVRRFFEIADTAAQIDAARAESRSTVIEEQSRIGYDLIAFVTGIVLGLSCGWRNENKQQRKNQFKGQYIPQKG